MKKLFCRKIASRIFFYLILLFAMVSCGAPPSENVEYGTDEKGSPEIEEIPSFPWPPPQPSAFMEIPNQLLQRDCSTLLEVNDQIISALQTKGYVEKSYFSVPYGFALVTRIEQINEDGSPKELPGRWSLEHSGIKDFSLSNYLEALFTADPGLHRVIVFVITPASFSTSGDPVSQDVAMEWLSEGLNTLPRIIANQQYSNDYKTTALIYEFQKPENSQVTQNLPSALSGAVHLEKAGLLSGLE